MSTNEAAVVITSYFPQSELSAICELALNDLGCQSSFTLYGINYLVYS